MAGTSTQYHSPFEGLFSGTKELGFSLSLITPSTWTCTGNCSFVSAGGSVPSTTAVCCMQHQTTGNIAQHASRLALPSRHRFAAKNLDGGCHTFRGAARTLPAGHPEARSCASDFHSAGTHPRLTSTAWPHSLFTRGVTSTYLQDKATLWAQGNPNLMMCANHAVHRPCNSKRAI